MASLCNSLEPSCLGMTVAENARKMEISVSIQGVWVRGTSSCKVDVILYDPLEDVMANKTSEVIGSTSVEWSFGPDEIDRTGEYYIFVHCKKGVALISISGSVTYL